MMGERRVVQEALFYGFSFERHIPESANLPFNCALMKWPLPAQPSRSPSTPTWSISTVRRVEPEGRLRVGGRSVAKAKYLSSQKGGTESPQSARERSFAS